MATPTHLTQSVIFYPESDGKPMAENTKQFEYITTLKGGLDALFSADAQVFVAGDLFWYPVEGNPRIVTAPDVMVVIGRPKGHRGSYRQWEEGNVAPQVVFEILSPANTVLEMTRKAFFYETHGVQEYYIYNPDTNDFEVYLRESNDLQPVLGDAKQWTSPLLKIRFDTSSGELKIYRPDGEPFRSYVELDQQLALERIAREEERRAKEEALAELERLRAQLNQRKD